MDKGKSTNTSIKIENKKVSKTMSMKMDSKKDSDTHTKTAIKTNKQKYNSPSLIVKHTMPIISWIATKKSYFQNPSNTTINNPTLNKLQGTLIFIQMRFNVTQLGRWSLRVASVLLGLVTKESVYKAFLILLIIGGSISNKFILIIVTNRINMKNPVYQYRNLSVHSNQIHDKSMPCQADSQR